MTTNKEVDSLLAVLDKTVGEALAYFEGPGSQSKVRVGNWGDWEVLCHFVFWHEVTVEGMKSVARGGSPYRLDAGWDELNARTIAQHQGESFLKLTTRLRELHKELHRVVHSLPDLDTLVMIRADETTVSGRERLEMMNRHWVQHVAELQAVES